MKNWNNIGAVILYSLENRAGVRYDSLEAAVATLGRRYWHAINPLDYCNVKGYIYFSSYTWMSGRVTWSVNGDEYLIKDDLDLVIPHWKILEVYENLTEPEYRYWRYRGPYKFRDGPVPGIRCWKPYRRNNRNGRPQLFQEYRNMVNSRDDEDIQYYKIKVRPQARTKFHDFMCRDSRHEQEERNWKSFRKTRWK